MPKYNSELMRMRRMLKAFLIKNRKTVKRMLPDKGKYLKNAFPNAYRLYCFLKKILKFTRLRLLYRLNILNARNTINRIVKYNMSISRFGDGETPYTKELTAFIQWFSEQNGGDIHEQKAH